MPAAYTDLFIECGADFVTTITLDDAYGNLYDLTNYVAASQIRKSYYSLAPTANLVISIPNTTQGVIVLSIDAANTRNIAAGRYVYDVYIKDTANNVTSRVLEGIVNVTPQVTIL